jgi:hypothetical protein
MPNMMVTGDAPIYTSSSISNLVDAGFTTNYYIVKPDTQYTLFASDHGRYVFDHWQKSDGTVLPPHTNLRVVAINYPVPTGPVASLVPPLVAVYRDLGTDPVSIDTSQPITQITVPSRGDALISITKVPSGPLNLPLSFSQLPGSGLVTLKLNGVIGTGSVTVRAQDVPTQAGTTAKLGSAIFTVGGPTAAGGTVLELDTSAIVFSGNAPNAIQISIPYDANAAVAAGVPQDTSHIKLLHFDGITWVDVTTAIDTANHTVAGVISTSASPIGVGYLPGTSTNSGGGGSSGAGGFGGSSSGGGGSGGGSDGAGGGGGTPTVLTDITTTTYPDSYFATSPLAKIQFNGSMVVVDASGNAIKSAKPGQQISLTSSFKNFQQEAQPYAFIVQITDKDGLTVDVSWQTGTLDAGKTISLSKSWTAGDSGTYHVKVLVLNKVTAGPLALSQPSSTALTIQ